MCEHFTEKLKLSSILPGFDISSREKNPKLKNKNLLGKKASKNVLETFEKPLQNLPEELEDREIKNKWKIRCNLEKQREIRNKNFNIQKSVYCPYYYSTLFSYMIAEIHC